MPDTKWRCPVTQCTVVYVLPRAGTDPGEAGRLASMALADHLTREHTSDEIHQWLMSKRLATS